MLTITLYIITILFLVISFSSILYSLHIYREALRLNPKAMTEQELDTEIKGKQVIINQMDAEIDRINQEKAQAERIIEEGKSWKNFLANYDAEYQQKQQTIKDLQDQLVKLGKDCSEQAAKLQELNKQISDKNKELDDLSGKQMAIDGKINQKNNELRELESKQRQEEDAFNKLKAEIGKYKAEVGKLQQEKGSLEKEIKELEKNKKDLEDSYVSRRKNAEDELRKLRDSKNELTSEVAQLQTEISGLTGNMKGVKASMDKIWEDLDSKPQYTIKIDKNSERKHESELDLLEAFKSNLKENNIKFDDRIINAFHTGLKVEDNSPLVVLSGISGTGKSLLPKLYCQAMGMNFLTVPVQPRWDSPQDMMGFYNYMQNKYKATELSRLLWDMDSYNNKNGIIKDISSPKDAPMNLVLLDEMNLARVEYYFSDLLSKLEFKRMISKVDDPLQRATAEIEIECGAIGDKVQKRRLYIGQNILFTGTMNEDETTQMLSDKVMDRSNVLRFGKPEKLESNPNIAGFGDKYANLEYMSLAQWKSFKNSNRDNTRDLEYISNINLTLARINRPFAHRVWQSIEAYVSLYPDSQQQDAHNNALSDQIEMKILPKLNGVEKDNPSVKQALNTIQNEIEKLNDEALNKAYKAVVDDTSNAFFQWRGVVR